MPNNFGGDQMDPDYAPHLYDEEGKYVSNQNDRRVPRVAESPDSDSIDRRVRSAVRDFRVVMPEGRQKGAKFYVNNSAVVIEKRSKDARGVEKWDRVTSLSKPNHGDGDEVNHALYWILAGPDAE